MFKNLLLLILFTALTSVGISQQRYYLGVGNPTDEIGTSCASCHKQNTFAVAVYEEWKGTAHASAQDSMNLPYYGYDCLSCHNTGWNATVTNYGADEYVTSNPLGTPNYVINDPVKFAKVANVGCESCHGPAGDANNVVHPIHWSGNYKPSLKAEVCGSCHEGEHHPYYSEWKSSLHADAGLTKPFIVNNKSCVKCHVAQNFIAYANNPEGYRDTILVTGADMDALTCVACHDPHKKEHEGQLRFPTTATTSICEECHTSEVEEVVDLNSEPHHTTAEVLSGNPNFGYQYPGEAYFNSGHSFAATRRCLNCHVYRVPFKDEANPAKTGHTFEPSVEACVSCHSDYLTSVDTSNHDKRFNYRGVQTTIDSLMNVLQVKLNSASSSDSASTGFKAARYNLLAIENEGSRGIHNTRLVRDLLLDAINKFNPTSVEKEEGIPYTYALSQNYPNPFNPITTIKFSIPQASSVKIYIYDALGNLIQTLVDGNYNQGNYAATWNAAGNASGIYFYKIEAGKYYDIKKMVLVK